MHKIFIRKITILGFFGCVKMKLYNNPINIIIIVLLDGFTFVKRFYSFV